MTTAVIPTTTDPQRYNQTIELSGVVFGLDFYFNSRANRWYLTVRDADGNAIRQGQPLVVNWDIFRAWVQQGRPEGLIVPINAHQDVDPNAETLGVDAFLAYIT